MKDSPAILRFTLHAEACPARIARRSGFHPTTDPPAEILPFPSIIAPTRPLPMDRRVLLQHPDRLLKFLLIARHGGMSAALPHLPYPVTLPTLSEHLTAFESDLGGPLFQRSPFRLNPRGRELAALFPHLLEQLAAGPQRIAQLTGAAPSLQIAADPAIGIARLRQILAEIPRTEAARLDLRWHPWPECQRLLARGENDLVLTMVPTPNPRGPGLSAIGIHPLSLLVPRKSPIRSDADLWIGGPPPEPLILPGENHALTATWRRGLEQGRLTWPAQFTVDALETMQAMVSAGLGFGLALGRTGGDGRRKTEGGPIPAEPRLPPGLREIALLGFDPVAIVCLEKP